MIIRFRRQLASRILAITGIAIISATQLSRPLLGQTGAWSTGSGGTIYYNGGSVGVGTASPGSIGVLTPASGYTTALDVVGPIRSQAGIISFENANPTGDPSNAQAVLYNKASAGPTVSGAMFTVRTAPWASGPTVERLRVDPSGNVGIGTASPQYKLSVNGTIGTKEVVVTNTGWADYVLKPGYRLRPLSELEAYITEHHMLPDIPSEQDIRAKGVGLAEMQVKLLAKVEELTLHVIQLGKENKELREMLLNERSRPTETGSAGPRLP